MSMFGPSGHGKTTCCRQFSDVLADYQGQITWDAQNYQKLYPRSCRDQILYMYQAPYIFNDTIRFNSLLGQQVAVVVCQHAM